MNDPPGKLLGGIMTEHDDEYDDPEPDHPVFLAIDAFLTALATGNEPRPPRHPRPRMNLAAVRPPRPARNPIGWLRRRTSTTTTILRINPTTNLTNGPNEPCQ